jgi:large subunit ribosomal protein L55
VFGSGFTAAFLAANLRGSFYKRFQMNVVSQLSSCCRQQIPQLLGKQSQLVWQQARYLNANRAAVTKIKRARFQYLYSTTLVQPDGSTIQVKYPEPRVLIRLPLDPETATPAQKRKIQFIRSPKQTLKVVEDTGEAFDPSKYLKL